MTISRPSAAALAMPVPNASAILNGAALDGIPPAQITELLCRNNPPVNANNPGNPDPACATLPARINYGAILVPVLAR
jgi:hypothetical protein